MHAAVVWIESVGATAFPLFAYLALAICTLKQQRASIPNRLEGKLDARMNVNLTFVGVALAVINLLITMPPHGLRNVQKPVKFFAISLACFLISYLLLHLRLMRLFETASDAFTTNGLWTTVVGLRELFTVIQMPQVKGVFSIVLIVLFVAVCADLLLRFNTREKK